MNVRVGGVPAEKTSLPWISSAVLTAALGLAAACWVVVNPLAARWQPDWPTARPARVHRLTGWRPLGLAGAQNH